jgi:hypothetical protein
MNLNEDYFQFYIIFDFYFIQFYLHFIYINKA